MKWAPVTRRPINAVQYDFDVPVAVTYVLASHGYPYYSDSIYEGQILIQYLEEPGTWRTMTAFSIARGEDPATFAANVNTDRMLYAKSWRVVGSGSNQNGSFPLTKFRLGTAP